MDNNNLTQLLQDSTPRHFFLKPIGRAGVPMTHSPEIWPDTTFAIHFTNNPPDVINTVEEGDILIGYRTGASRLIFVAERLPQEQQRGPEPGISAQALEDFPVWLTARNLTPDYGRFWNDRRLRRFNLKPWRLHEQFSRLHPDLPFFSLGRLQYGHTVLPIPPEFGRFLIEQIEQLPALTPCEETAYG